MPQELPPLLLHICCGPCGCGCLGRLKEEGRQVMLYFSNSNLNTREEFEHRLTAVNKVADYFGLKVLVDPYDHQAWLDWIASVPDFASQPERGLRCSRCFAWSLGRTAAEAARRNMNFATTLTVSPHKNSTLIFEIGRQYANFEQYDFKKQNGFLKSLTLSKELGLYRQDFCGCEFSLRQH